MNRKRTRIARLLALMLIFALALNGCGGQGTQTAAFAAAPAQTEVPAAAPAQTELPATEPPQTEVPAAEPAEAEVPPLPAHIKDGVSVAAIFADAQAQPIPGPKDAPEGLEPVKADTVWI